MMGVRLPSYYASLVTVHLVTFLLIALFASLTLIAGGTFVLSSPGIVVVFFIAFAFAAFAFAAALSPFFYNAKVAAVVGPLALFISAQLINLFIDTSTGILLEGNARGEAPSMTYHGLPPTFHGLQPTFHGLPLTFYGLPPT